MHHLILLHGAIGSSEQLRSLADELSTSFIIHNPDFPGHGGNETKIDFTIQYFAEHVKAYCQMQGIHSVSIFGYSMGGYVALYLARHYPSLVKSIITLATKFVWDKEIAEKECNMLVPETIEKKIPAFAEILQQRHAPADWKKVLHKTCTMLKKLGENNELNNEDLSAIAIPVLVMIGDRDKMVSIEETKEAYKQLSNSQLSVLPSTPHQIERTDPVLLAFIIRKFFN